MVYMGSQANATESPNPDECELGLVRHGDQRWWIMHPFSVGRSTIDIISLLFVLYDLIFVPLGFFGMPQGAFFNFMEWVVRLFWTLDMFLSFFKGVVLADGSIEMRPWPIARRYLRSWLVCDLLINVLDWVEVCLPATDETTPAGLTRGLRASRGIRILRLVRLFRLLRLREVVDLMGERIASQWILVMFSVMKNVLAIVSIAHLLACIWYGVGTKSNESTSWVKVYGYDSAPFEETYLMCLQWALSQFAGGMDEITAENAAERGYNIFCFLLAFVMGASFISNLTSSMTQLHILGSNGSQDLMQLRQFLYQNKVSQRLMLRVQRNAQHAIVEQSVNMQEEGVVLLQRVSEPLLIEIHFEMYAPLLRSHCFLSGYADMYPQVVRRICHSAMSMALFSAGDVLFNAGEIPSRPTMYIVCSGMLHYNSMFDRHQVVEQGQCISEGTLWTRWTHLGTLVALSQCRLCRLDSQHFRDIVTRFQHDDLFYNPRVYAVDFVRALHRVGVELSDIGSDGKSRGSPGLEPTLAATNSGCGGDVLTKPT